MTALEALTQEARFLPEVLAFTPSELDLFARVHTAPPHILMLTDAQKKFFRTVSWETDAYLRGLATEPHFSFIQECLSITQTEFTVASTAKAVTEFLSVPGHAGVVVLFGGYNLLERQPAEAQKHISQIIISRSHENHLHGVHVYGKISTEAAHADQIVIIEDMSDRGPAIAKSIETILIARGANLEEVRIVNFISQELDTKTILPYRKRLLSEMLVSVAKKHGIVIAFPFSKNGELLESLIRQSERDDTSWSHWQRKLVEHVASFEPTQWIEGRWVDTSYTAEHIIHQVAELYPALADARGAIQSFFSGITLDKTLVRVGATSPNMLYLTGEHPGGYQLVAVAKIWARHLEKLLDDNAH